MMASSSAICGCVPPQQEPPQGWDESVAHEDNAVRKLRGKRAGQRLADGEEFGEGLIVEPFLVDDQALVEQSNVGAGPAEGDVSKRKVGHGNLDQAGSKRRKAGVVR